MFFWSAQLFHLPIQQPILLFFLPPFILGLLQKDEEGKKGPPFQFDQSKKV